MRLLAIALAGLVPVFAAVVTYDFNITWVLAAPDGFTRPVIGINNEWPIPTIRCVKGDSLVINVRNQLGNQSTSLHFHGIFQNGTNHMDGTVGVTQCAIPPGSSFTYNFKVDQPGTYWYHSHQSGQFADGLRGPLIVKDPDSPYAGRYDDEVVLTLSDWYHKQAPELIDGFMSRSNPTGAEPVPDSGLLNDTQDLKVPVLPGKTIFLRLANVGAIGGQYFWIEGHSMRVIEVDGVYTEEKPASMLYIATGQRYGVLVETRNSTKTNFAIVGHMDKTVFDKIDDSFKANVTGWLVYNSTAPLNRAAAVAKLSPLDDMNLVPQDRQLLLPESSRRIQFDVSLDVLSDGRNYAFFNNVTWVGQKVPSLYSALTTGNASTDPMVYSMHVNPQVVRLGEVVDIVVNNHDPAKHPFHFHGRNFQVLSRADESSGDYKGGTNAFPRTPIRRDTILINSGSNVVLRYRADNPGVWLFHCHIEWHMVQGMAATFIEAPAELQDLPLKRLPSDHLAACRKQGLPTTGNAAGNTVNLLDLSAENRPPPPLPPGFTARGIIALVFSIAAAFGGIATIGWYGMAETEEDKNEQEN